VPLSMGGAGSPSNVMWPEPRPTSLPSGILIHPTTWLQYTNVTDRTGQTGQRSDMIGRAVLQTVAQKPSIILHSNYIAVDYAVLAIAIESKPVLMHALR